MQLGITTFAEVTEPGGSPGERLRQVVEEAVLAEQVGLSVDGVDEHHRADMAASAPAVVLATIAGRTGRIRLSSAVTVLSSADPVPLPVRLAVGGTPESVVRAGTLGLQRFEMHASHVGHHALDRAVRDAGGAARRGAAGGLRGLSGPRPVLGRASRAG